VFPILIRHTDAFEFAVDHTLPAIDAAVHVILHHVFLGSPVQDNQLDGIGWTILDT
jgi:hypothetical protein